MLSELMKECRLCPRSCRADREKSSGYCGAGAELKIARAALHFWEEPCISGKYGSGTVFFSYCSLKCVYCQNYEISHLGFGEEISAERLREIYFELIEKGAHNINLVTPSHYIPLIVPTLRELPVPVVVNCGGYENVETIKMLKGRANIYLPDIKYALKETAESYSSAPDYPERAFDAVEEMISQVGAPVIGNDGIMKSGVIIRHMVLPNETKNSIAVIKKVAERFGGHALFSLMSQYTPCGEAKNIKRIARRLTPSEYARVLRHLEESGLEGYAQELSSASEEYIPPFDLSGVRRER